MYAVILASGSSRRFGSNKLLTFFKGRPLFLYALENALSCPEITDIIVVTKYPEIESIIQNYVDILKPDSHKKIEVIHNSLADEGISSSIRLGSEAAFRLNLDNSSEGHISEVFSIIYMVADQPFLKKETLGKLVASHIYTVRKEIIPVISVLCFGDTNGNPVIFTSHFMKDLLQLKGDMGGKFVLRNALSSGTDFILNKVESTDERELLDIDKKEDMKQEQ